MTEDTRTMVASPIAALLKSRKFMALLVALLADAVVALVPVFEPVREQLITVISALFGALILGISHEDAASNSSTPPGGTTLEESRKVTTGAPVTPPEESDAPQSTPFDPRRHPHG